MHKNKNGFSMLEMLIVLYIVSTISIVVVVGVKNYINHDYINKTIKLLGSDINLVQTQSIVKGCNSYVKIQKDGYQVYVCDQFLKEVVFFKSVVATNNFDNQILINKYGNINRAGTIKFKRANQEKKMIYSLGEGRYRVE